MNYKLLFPTYRNRYLFINEYLKKYQVGTFANALNLGMGEGDYDAMIARKCVQLMGCDINESDVAFAKSLNANLENVS